MIYFDHNASTPVRPEAADAMGHVLRELHGNASSTHREGQRVRAALEEARADVAALVGSRTDEVVFVSGGTEGDHAGLVGAAWSHEARGRRVAISAIEHHAVHGSAAVLERMGFAIEHLGVDANGLVDPASIDALPEDTTVVSVMLANNETGAIQPIAAIAERARARGIAVHCDAVQAGGKIPIDMAALGVSYLVISAHKLGGPKGAGALIFERNAPFESLFRGSAHEKGRRGGTENAPSIVGFGVAARLAREKLQSEQARLLELRNGFETRLAAAIPDMVVHAAGAPRLPNTVNASFPGARSDTLLMALDSRGVAVSAGAACSSGAVEPSPVLGAMRVPVPLATSALRMSMGWTTTEDEMHQVAAAVIDAVGTIRKTSPKVSA